MLIQQKLCIETNKSFAERLHSYHYVIGEGDALEKVKDY